MRTLTIEWAISAAFAAVTFLILYGAFALLKRAHVDDLPIDRSIVIGGQQVNFSVKPVLRVVAVAVSLLIALATGAAMAAPVARAMSSETATATTRRTGFTEKFTCCPPMTIERSMGRSSTCARLRRANAP